MVFVSVSVCVCVFIRLLEQNPVALYARYKKYLGIITNWFDLKYPKIVFWYKTKVFFHYYYLRKKNQCSLSKWIKKENRNIGKNENSPTSSSSSLEVVIMITSIVIFYWSDNIHLCFTGRLVFSPVLFEHACIIWFLSSSSSLSSSSPILLFQNDGPKVKLLKYFFCKEKNSIWRPRKHFIFK